MAPEARLRPQIFHILIKRTFQSSMFIDFHLSLQVRHGDSRYSESVVRCASVPARIDGARTDFPVRNDRSK